MPAWTVELAEPPKAQVPLVVLVGARVVVLPHTPMIAQSPWGLRRGDAPTASLHSRVEPIIGPMSDSVLGPRLQVDDHLVLTGSCSWTDRTLLEADWYPKRTMTAEERLRFYAGRFPLTEVDSTYYAPPAEQQTRLWAERTPDGFRFDVKAYSLLTGHPTRPKSLWKDLREQLPEDVAGKRNVYAHHLDPEALNEAWRRFESALRPLHDAGKLGGVLFQYPPWFVPRRENRHELETLRGRLPDYRICVEFRSPMWLAEERDRERTLAMLEDQGLVFVCCRCSRGVEAAAVAGRHQLRAVRRPLSRALRQHVVGHLSLGRRALSLSVQARGAGGARAPDRRARRVGERDASADEQLLPRLRRAQRCRVARRAGRHVQRRGAQPPVNTGGRFSTKAATPSRKSLVRPSLCWSSPSRCSCASRLP